MTLVPPQGIAPEAVCPRGSWGRTHARSLIDLFGPWRFKSFEKGCSQVLPIVGASMAPKPSSTDTSH